MRVHDLLVIGGGLAGLRAALAADSRLDIAVVSKLYPTQSHSGAAQGGFNAAIDPDDHWEKHMFDTVKGSDYLGDQDAIAAMCQEAPATIYELERLGVLWSRRPDGTIAQRSLGGAGFPRTCFAADLSGHMVLNTLYEQALGRSIRFYNEWHLVEILVEEGAVAGGLFLDLRTGQLEVIRCKVMILATGGAGQVFAKTTNGLACTGDGMALAYRAGAALADLEFVQFHPTSIWGKGFLLSEACRGEGGYLLNAHGERFMERYAPKAMELAPRDVVSRSIFEEIKAGRAFPGGYVHLDLTHLGAERLRERLPQVLDLAQRYAGVNAIERPIPIEPAQHYTMGGIRTAVHGETTLPGLLACGEAACVSVHGANRLGGNSLLETVVFGKLAGIRAGQIAEGRQGLPAKPDGSLSGAMERWESLFKPGPATGDSPARLRRELNNTMTDLVGVFRTESELTEAKGRIEGYRARLAGLRAAGRPRSHDYALVELLNLGYLLDVAGAMAEGAHLRQESRGAHYRTDYPERNDAKWLAHTIVQRGRSGRPEPGFEPVRITKFSPQARTY